MIMENEQSHKEYTALTKDEVKKVLSDMVYSTDSNQPIKKQRSKVTLKEDNKHDISGETKM